MHIGLYGEPGGLREDIGYPKLAYPNRPANATTADPQIVSTNICGSDHHMCAGARRHPGQLLAMRSRVKF